jgi:hypothetical protein
MKDIEGLAAIGEEVILGRLDNIITVNIKYVLEEKSKLKSAAKFWKEDFKAGVLGYVEVRTIAVSLGLDVSEYDKEVSELTEEYSQLTGENEFTIRRTA